MNDSGSLISPSGSIHGLPVPAEGRLAFLRDEGTGMELDRNNPYGDLFGFAAGAVGNSTTSVGVAVAAAAESRSTHATTAAAAAAIITNNVSGDKVGVGGVSGGGSNYNSERPQQVDLREMAELKRQNELLASELALARGAMANTTRP